MARQKPGDVLCNLSKCHGTVLQLLKPASSCRLSRSRGACSESGKFCDFVNNTPENWKPKMETIYLECISCWLAENSKKRKVFSVYTLKLLLNLIMVSELPPELLELDENIV